MAAKIKRFVLNLKGRNIGCRLLALGGMWFIPSGIILICLSWHPTSSPYIIGERYPFGTLSEAWQISLDFSWIAFGLLFVGIALSGGRDKSRWVWFSLLISIMLVLFPHIWIGVNLVLDDPTLRNFGLWLIALPFSFLWLLELATGFVLSYQSR